MRNIRLRLAYKGSAYQGFQTQPGGKTVQDELEKAILRLTGEKVKVHGSGRTDAGVHARMQVVNFLTSSRIPAERWSLAVNSHLPDDILVYEAVEVSPRFHARRSAKTKTYCYTIHNSVHPNIFDRDRQLHLYRPLDTEAMQEAAQYLVGEHDFSAFCSPRSSKENHVRRIYACMVDKAENQLELPVGGAVVRIMVTGNGFLYNMVRIIAGTLIQVGEGKRSAGSVGETLHSMDRSKAGPTAPAHGLILWDVSYEE